VILTPILPKTYGAPSGHRKCLIIMTKVLVEAAGVEPASEKARHVKTTCVSGSGVSAAPYITGKSEHRLARLISICCSGPKLSTYPAK
jgi:hypothetical protein